MPYRGWETVLIKDGQTQVKTNKVNKLKMINMAIKTWKMKPEKDLITTCKNGYLFSNSITNVWKLASQEKLVTLNSPPPLHDIKQEDDKVICHFCDLRGS